MKQSTIKISTVIKESSDDCKATQQIKVRPSDLCAKLTESFRERLNSSVNDKLDLFRHEKERSIFVAQGEKHKRKNKVELERKN